MKVLLIDADAQGSLTASLEFMEPDKLEETLATVMISIINEEIGVLQQYRQGWQRQGNSQTIDNYNAGEQTATLYTRDKAVMRKLDTLVDNLVS